MEGMKDIPDGSVDMVLTDPPYGIDYQSRRPRPKHPEKRFPKIMNDKVPFTMFIPLLKRILKPSACVMIFTRWDVQQRFVDAMDEAGLRVKNVLIWDKLIHGMGDLKRSYASRYESILFHSGDDFLFSGKRPQDIISARRVLPQNLLHPNEKPVELLEQLICQCTERGAAVLDPFMGSGSTGVACVNTGRNFIGIEIDPDYFAAAAKRICAAQEKGGI